MSRSVKPALQAAGLLGLVALAAVGLLAWIESATRDRIAAAEHAARLQALSAVLTPGRWDNAPFEDVVLVLAPRWLGREEPMQVWRARAGDEPAQLIVQTTAPRGYSGPIEMLVGVDAGGRVVGVRVTRHQETPGLGDAIEPRRSDWIDDFAGRSLGDPSPERWRVRRDGGDFDQFTGATITPRAVVNAVADTLAFVEAHAERLYAAPAGSTLRFDDAPPERPRP